MAICTGRASDVRGALPVAGHGEAPESLSLPARVFLVIGTRPEAIKMLPVAQALRATALETTIVVTGQHKEMLDQAFDCFGETPDVDLGLMTHGQTLAGITSLVLTRMSELIEQARPDVVLVHGDTTTAMASAMAAFYARTRIGHVEAGLRSFDLARPFPEEMNRVFIDGVADFLFAPTETARDNLAAEYGRGKVYVTGNTGIDALLSVSARLDADASASARFAERYALDDRDLVLVTGHRRESFGDGFENICRGLVALARRPNVRVIYPVHLNPNVRTVVRERLAGIPNVTIVDPVDYLDMVFLMKRAKILLTDSGGIQEEGPALGKPVFVMRDVTERPEALTTGVVTLIGADADRIENDVGALLDDPALYETRARAVFPYGDGTAARRIATILSEELS